jgi:hypothetical protein
MCDAAGCRQCIPVTRLQRLTSRKRSAITHSPPIVKKEAKPATWPSHPSTPYSARDSLGQSHRRGLVALHPGDCPGVGALSKVDNESMTHGCLPRWNPYKLNLARSRLLLRETVTHTSQLSSGERYRPRDNSTKSTQRRRRVSSVSIGVLYLESYLDRYNLETGWHLFERHFNSVARFSGPVYKRPRT